MKLLFLHPNFPGQFLHLAMYFAQTGRDEVVYLSKETNGSRLRNVKVALYKPTRETTKDIHPYVRPLEEAVLEGQAVVRGLSELQKKGFVPDVVVGHSGWGSTLYVKDFYPKTPLIGYFEWYYNVFGSDVVYWPDETASDDARLRLRTRNAHHLLALEATDIGYCPTEWQRKQFPARHRDWLQVAHEGIDTDYFCPKEGAGGGLTLTEAKLRLPQGREIVTYVSRGFEPYRGFPQFMDAVRLLLARRPKCHVVLAGSDRSCYGPAPADGKTWRQIEEEKGGYDAARVHFVGRLNRADYLRLLQASTVHVYLTRPFVLSWSPLEAMAAGCCLVGSATPPVEEVVEDGVNGLLASFRHPAHIADRIEEALEDEGLRARLGTAARETILSRYNLPEARRRQLNLIYSAVQ